MIKIDNKNFIVNLITTVPVSGLVHDGIAQLLGLEVLRHGTSWSNAISILNKGALAGHGGATTRVVKPEDPDLAKKSCGFVHVFRDSDFGGGVQGMAIPFAFVKRGLAKKHTWFATKAQITNYSGIIAKGIRLFAGIFCPTIRFMFKPEELSDRFEKDPFYGEAAYRTRRNIQADRIGLIGAFNHGWDGRVVQRLKADPTKALIGVAQLTAGIALTILGLGFIF